MNNRYEYVGQPLTLRIAQELIVELFTGKTARRQEIIETVDEVHLERGGLPAQSIYHPVERALSDMKRSGLAENPRHGFWSIPSPSNTIEGTEVAPVHSENAEPRPITTLDAFLEWTSQFDSEEGSETYLFRGVPKKTYKIDASAYRRLKKGRNGDEQQDGDFERFLQINRDLIRDARFRGHDRKNGQKLEDLEILAEFQHYGAATCLIDFTYNPLVALWFSCKQEANESQDGKVVAVRPEDSTSTSEITLESLGKNIDELFQDNEDNLREKLYQWQPRHQNNRIIAQQSIFLFGILEINPAPDKECIIDGSSKEKIRESLQRIYGITEDMLFPDFDGFARQHSQEIPYTQFTASQCRERGIRAYERGEYREAIADFDRAINREPDYAETYYWRGLAKSQLGQYDEAVTDFDTAID